MESVLILSKTWKLMHFPLPFQTCAKTGACGWQIDSTSLSTLKSIQCSRMAYLFSSLWQEMFHGVTLCLRSAVKKIAVSGAEPKGNPTPFCCPNFLNSHYSTMRNGRNLVCFSYKNPASAADLKQKGEIKLP